MKTRLSKGAVLLEWLAIFFAILSGIAWIIAANDGAPSNILIHMGGNDNVIIKGNDFTNIGKSLSYEGVWNIRAAYCAAGAAFFQGASLLLKKLSNN